MGTRDRRRKKTRREKIAETRELKKKQKTKRKVEDEDGRD